MPTLLEEVIALDGPNKPRVLLYDVETTPILGYAWRKWKTNLVHIVEDPYLLCYAYKWLGKKHVQWVRAETPGDDADIADTLWRLLNQADWVIAHNADGFDNKVANARFLQHGHPPPSSYESIDTLKWSRKNFHIPSHALNDVSRQFFGTEKEPHQGFKMWLDCMANDPAAWRVMKRYNIGDVQRLEDWYLRIRPWVGRPGTRAPNMSHWSNGVRVCTGCGYDELVAIGTFRRTHEYEEWRCTNCGKPSRARLRRQESEAGEPRLT